MSNTRTQSLIVTAGNNAHFHRLLPDESSLYDLHTQSSFPKNYETDIAFSSLLPSGSSSTSILIKKARIAILGPKTAGKGGVLLVIEKSTDANFWIPILACDDGQAMQETYWPAGLPMDNTMQFCFSVQFTQYADGLNASDWTFGGLPTHSYRSVEVDLDYDIL